MSSKHYFVISGLIFSLVAIAHLLRVINGASVQIDGYAIPMAVSWLGLIVTATLASWAFRLAQQETQKVG